MSKNLTRKGLAFGAVVALGTTLFAGAPAQAASVLFAPTTGTGNTLVAGETFSLTASLSSDLPTANSTQLKFKVTNTTGVDATVKINSNTISAVAVAATRPAGYGPVALDAAVGGTTSASNALVGTVAGTSKVFGIGQSFAENAAVVSGASTATNPTSVQIVSTAATTASYAVVAFLDANNNGTVDSGELSSEQTVNFVKIADAGVVTTLAAPTVDETKFKATVAFATNINVAQLTAANYSVALGKYVAGVKTAASAATVYATVAGSPVAYDSTNNNLKVYVSAADGATNSLDASNTFVAGATYSAQAVFGAALVGNESIKVAATPVATAIATPSTTVSNNVSGSGTAYAVRSGVTSFTVSSALTKADGDDAGSDPDSVGAGVAAVVTVGESIDSTTTITVGGKTLTSTTTSTTFDAVTNADGKIVFTVTSSTGKATDAVTVSIKTSGVAATSTVTYTWTAATIPAAAAGAGLINLRATGVTSTTKAGTYTLEYALVDSFGALVKTTGYRVSVSAPGTGTDATTSTKQVEFVNGKASVALTDGSTATGSVTATATVQAWDATAGNWVSTLAGSLLTTGRTLATTVYVISNTATAITAAAGVGTAIETKDFVTGDTRLDEGSITVPSWVSTGNTVAGTLTDAVGGVVKGKAVTVSAAGVLFSADDVYSLGSITVYTDNSGQYTVNTFSHKAGKVTYTVTSEGLTKTVDVTYAAVDDNSGTSLVVDAPATILPGRTLVVTGVLTDKFGNPVNTVSTTDASNDAAGELLGDFSVAYDGPGLIVGSLPTETDADGKFTFRVLLGASETGSASVTAKYDANGDLDYADTGDLSVAKTITIGAAPVVATAAASGSTGKFFASVTNAAGKKVVVKVSDKFVTSFTGTLAKKSVAVAALKGNRTVTIYVGGQLVLTKLVTIK